MNLNKLSPAAREIADLMGQGMRLAVPRDEVSGPHRLIDGYPEHPRIPAPPPDQDVSEEIAKELLSSGLLWGMTEYKSGARIGWRECGLPGDKYWLFSLVQ